MKQIIGARIKEIRARNRINKERLAERMGINPKYLSSIERGKENPSLNTLIKLSESLEVDLGEIFSLLQIEDPAKRKSLIISLLDDADSEQLKIIFKIISAIIH
jgi:transcriptional regulator with XRE-family HTH domain